MFGSAFISSLIHLHTSGTLDKHSIPDIMEILQPIAMKWEEIGRALNVKKQVLDDFANNPELVREGLEGFLRATLNAVDALTVKTLIDALRSPSVQEEDTARALEGHLIGKG